MIDIVKMVKKINLTDAVVVAAILIYSLIVWWPSRFLPYFWDSSGYVIQTARDFLTQNFTNLTSPHTNFPHPPLFTATLALMWKQFGISQLNSHLLMLPFLPLYMVGTYYLVRRYTDKTYALFAALLVGLSPAALAEYFNIYVDLPSAALGVVALALAAHQKNRLSWILFSLALLIKIPLITLLPFFFLNTEKKQRWWVALPLLTVVGWFIYHYQMTGWWLYEPGRESATPTTITGLISSIIFVCQTFFLEQGKYAWTTLVVLSLFFTNLTKASALRFIKQYQSVLLSLSASLGLFIYTAEFSPRYALYFMPLFVLIIALILQRTTTRASLHPLITLGVMLTVLGVTTLNWRGSTQATSQYEYQSITNLAILDAITTFRQVASTLQLVAPEAQIYGGFPEDQMLTQPIQGYVSQALDFHPCAEYEFDPTVLQIVVVHPYAPSQIPCRLLLDSQKLLPLNRFENNGRWVELYQVDATQSATPTK